LGAWQNATFVGLRETQYTNLLLLTYTPSLELDDWVEPETNHYFHFVQPMHIVELKKIGKNAFL